MPETRDAYLILQLHPSAVPELIEAAYRTLARLHHPDHSEAPDAGAAMADLNWAYATLREPALRAAYDRTKVAIPVDGHEPAGRQAAVASSSLSQRVAQAAAAAAERDAGSAAATTLDFGRYAGMTLREIAGVEPGYLEWLRRHSSGLRYRHQIDQVLAALTPQRSGSAE
ncbi:MAG TPA: DnaJ domain-containing protein [Candidatus Limnocylindria bacterium]